MGWSKVAIRVVCASLGLGLVLGGCGGAEGSHSADPATTAGSGVGGGTAGSTTAAAGASGAATAGHDAGGAVTSGGSAAGAHTTTGAAGGPANIFVDQLRGRSGCLPRALPVATAADVGFEAGQVRCLVAFATFPAAGGCTCDPSQQLKPAAASFAQGIANNVKQSGSCDGTSGEVCSNLCVCELEQCRDDALSQCQSDAVTPIAELPPGFCYVDALAEPPLGNPEIQAMCAADSRRGLRVLGPAPTQPAPMMFLGCW